MPNAIEFIADRLPRVTVEDVRRFADTVEIRDARAFAAELQAFVHERVEAVKLPAPLEAETVEQALASKAAALRADTRWVPNETDVQRGRAKDCYGWVRWVRSPARVTARWGKPGRMRAPYCDRHHRPGSPAGASAGAVRRAHARGASTPRA